MNKLLLFLAFSLTVFGDNRVLVLYQNTSDSIAVANYYQSVRAVPSQNMCMLSFAGATNLLTDYGPYATPPGGSVTWAQYQTYVQGPIQACLSTANAAVTHIAIIRLRVFAIWDSTMQQDHSTSNYAIDSFIADVWDTAGVSTAANPHLWLVSAYHNTDNSGLGTYPAYISLTAYDSGVALNKRVYAVGRIDSPDTATSQKLIDDAIYAEGTGGPQGMFCFDDDAYGGYIQYYLNPHPGNFSAPGLVAANAALSHSTSSYQGVSWGILRALYFAQAYGFPWMFDYSGAEFGTSPAPLSCQPTAFFAGWYHFNWYNPPGTFSWVRGSMGFHFDSYMMSFPEAPFICCGSTTGAWGQNALAAGVTATVVNTTEQTTYGMVQPDSLLAYLLQGATLGESVHHGLILRWRSYLIGDPLYTPYKTPLVTTLGHRGFNGVMTRRGTGRIIK